MAFTTRPTLNGVSIGGVYTPKEFRQTGYASALVTELSEYQLKKGKKFCILYNDTAKLSSNKIYQNVGYKEIAVSKNFKVEKINDMR